MVVEFLVPQELDVGGALLELRRQLRNPSFGSVREGMSGSAVTEVGSGGRAWAAGPRSTHARMYIGGFRAGACLPETGPSLPLPPGQ